MVLDNFLMHRGSAPLPYPLRYVHMEQKARLHLEHCDKGRGSESMLEALNTHTHRMLDRQAHARRVCRFEEVFTKLSNILSEALLGEVVVNKAASAGNVGWDRSR